MKGKSIILYAVTACSLGVLIFAGVTYSNKAKENDKYKVQYTDIAKVLSEKDKTAKDKKENLAATEKESKEIEANIEKLNKDVETLKTSNKGKYDVYQAKLTEIKDMKAKIYDKMKNMDPPAGYYLVENNGDSLFAWMKKPVETVVIDDIMTDREAQDWCYATLPSLYHGKSGNELNLIMSDMIKILTTIGRPFKDGEWPEKLTVAIDAYGKIEEVTKGSYEYDAACSTNFSGTQMHPRFPNAK